MLRTLIPLLLLALPLSLPGCGDSAAGSVVEQAGVTETSLGAAAGENSPDRPGASQASLGQNPQPSRSRLDFEFDEIDFGTIYQQQEFEVNFPFTVEGPDPVTLLALDPTCGCTDVYLTVNDKNWELGKPIPAGSKGEVRGMFHSNTYVDLKTSIIHITGDFINVGLRLHLQAFIRRHFKVTPSNLGLGTVSVGQLASAPVKAKFKVTGSEPFKVLRWSQLPRGIEVVEIGEPEMLEDGRQVRHFEVSLNDKNSAGALFQRLQAETSLHKPLTVDVSAQLLGPVQFKPSTLRFGAVNHGLTPRRALQIIATDPAASLPTPKIEFAGSEQYTWQLTERIPGREWVVRVHFDGDVDPGRFAGQLKVSFPAEVGVAQQVVKVSALVRAKQ